MIIVFIICIHYNISLYLVLFLVFLVLMFQLQNFWESGLCLFVSREVATERSSKQGVTCFCLRRARRGFPSFFPLGTVL